MQRLPQRTCANSIFEKWHPPECLFYKSERRWKFGEKCSCAHRTVEKQPSKRSEKNGDKSAVAMLKVTRQLGCVSQDMERPKFLLILRKSSNIRKQIRCVQSTKAVVRHADIRAQVILISVTPMLQNLRIGRRKRRNGKSDVPVKQHGGWSKMFSN